MNILADENIPFVVEAFSSLGEVETLPGRSIAPERLQGVEVLLVRTVTRVDEALLSNTPVRFVGSATSGFEHVDADYLEARGIGFAGAAGANATSVAEYVAGALAELAQRFDLQLSDLSLGIVGHGHVGKRVSQMASALGMRCVVNDPPLARATKNPTYRPLREILECDVITLHVPLEREGADPTYHLVNDGFLAQMKEGAILINTSRGGVVDEVALKKALRDERLKACVLDVWDGEPRPDPELIEMAAIATPHIAGYSLDGRVEGTRRILDAACAYLGLDAKWDRASLLPAPETPRIQVDPANGRALLHALREVYDILVEDAKMRRLCALDKAARAAAFDALRRDYPPRREFSSTVAQLPSPDKDLEKALHALGFQVASRVKRSAPPSR